MSSPAEFIPVIDLAPARPGSPLHRRIVASAIGEACERSGFLVVVGHGVDHDLVTSMYEVTRSFFGLGAEQKAEAAMVDGRGWREFGGYVAASKGIETPPDLCEMFNFSRLGEPGVAEHAGLGAELDRLGAPNRWPSSPPEFRRLWLDYYRSMEDLATDLMRLFALALDLPESWFDDKIDHHMTGLSANWYYPLSAPAEPGQFRKGPHTDWGSLTILHQDDVGGLQVRHPSGDWVDVPFIPGSYIINLGDLMACWTNDRWVSTMHRVVVPRSEVPDRGRISIPFFHQPNYDAIVETIPTCIPEEQVSRYAPVKSGEWQVLKGTAAYGPGRDHVAVGA